MNYCSEMPQNRAPIIVLREIVAATRTQWHGAERNDSEVRGQARGSEASTAWHILLIVLKQSRSRQFASISFLKMKVSILDK